MQYVVRHHDVLSFLPDSRRPVHELRFPIATALLAAVGKAAACTARAVFAPLLLLIAVAAPSTASFAANYTETFDSGSAPGWTVVSGIWAVSAGTANSTADGAADIAVYSGGSWATDFVYHVRINNPYNNGGNLAGAVYNYQDANNYYAVVFAPVGQLPLLASPQAHLRKVINGTTTEITAPYSGGGPNVWFDVDVMRSGTSTTVKVNGVTVFDNVTQSELGLGKIGLVTTFTHGQFDNVVLTETNSTAPFSENFDDGIANGWTVVSGTWAVDTGSYHSTGNGPTDITVYNSGSWATGFTYHASVNNGFNSYGNLAGAVYNYQDAANYYAVKFAPVAGPGTERLAHLVKVINGATTEITAPYSGGDPLVWFDVDVIRSGFSTTVNVNGITVFNNITQSELGAGKVGLITTFTDARFDNVSLSTGSDASPHPATLLFRSGFEPGTALSAPNNFFGTGAWQDISGTDNTTGFTWPINIWGGSTSKFQLLVDGSVDATTIDNYMVNRIETVTGHNGTPTQALYQENKQRGTGCCTQDSFQIQPASEQGDMYISKWMKFQPDLLQNMTPQSWRSVFEWKTAGDYRVIAEVSSWQDGCGSPDGITNKPNGPLFWQIQGDNVANGGLPPQVFWRVDNCSNAVPVDQWFKFEVFWHRSGGADGRVWMAVNGQVIVDHFGPNMGINNASIDRIFTWLNYSGTPYPIYQWIDDVQIWGGFPTATVGDAWYDPPYAPH